MTKRLAGQRWLGRMLLAFAMLAFGSVGWPGTSDRAHAATVNFSATIEGSQEVPPTMTGAMASGTFVMDTNANTLSYNIVITVPPPSGEIAAHIHGPAPPGANAGILFDFMMPGNKVGVWNFPEVREADIINGLTYVNIHSNAHPGGEIRGQILRVPSCGDGILDAGEQCDDGNNINGDCCSSTCELEADTCPNHYLCHQVKDLKVPAKFAPVAGISVVDQTGTFTCEAKKPKLLCNPANKNGSIISSPDLHYCCYQVKCVPKKVAADYDITDQFGDLRLQTNKPKFLCNPCAKAPVP